jgi:hypothetical protein
MENVHCPNCGWAVARPCPGHCNGIAPQDGAAPDQGSRQILACRLFHQLGNLQRYGVGSWCLPDASRRGMQSVFAPAVSPPSCPQWYCGPGPAAGRAGCAVARVRWQPRFAAPLPLCRYHLAQLGARPQSGAEPFRVVQAAPSRVVAHSRCLVGRGPGATAQWGWGGRGSLACHPPAMPSSGSTPICCDRGLSREVLLVPQTLV